MDEEQALQITSAMSFASFDSGSPMFYSPAIHDGDLAEVGMTLPFEPIGATDGLWRCGECGVRQRKLAVIETDGHRFYPNPILCQNTTMIHHVKQARRAYYASESAWVTHHRVGPLRLAEATTEWRSRDQHFEVLSSRPDLCRSNSWMWNLDQDALHQVRWLIILPKLAQASRLARGDDINLRQVHTEWGGFPDTWLPNDKLALLARHQRMLALELTVQKLVARQEEIVGRMAAAGYALGGV